MNSNEIVLASDTNALAVYEQQMISVLRKGVREEMLDSPYIAEALRVLPVQGYRSAIGCYWNAVIDDLRKKIIHRSLYLFNKEMNQKVNEYEDFQNDIKDNILIEGAYKIGVISWEARKLLNQARETRNIFDGHPHSTEPSLLKVLDLISDCNKYVLSEDYPPPVVNIDEYLTTMDTTEYHQSEIAIEQAVSDLPAVYKKELINRLYKAYIDESSSTVLRANIEFCAPVLWKYLSKEDCMQISKSFDKLVVHANRRPIKYGTEFLIKDGGLRYVSTASRKVIFEPAIQHLENSIELWPNAGKWKAEEEAVGYIERLGTNIPDELLQRYIASLTLIFIGYGKESTSPYYGQTSFYSYAATPVIEKIFDKFDDIAAQVFLQIIKENKKLKERIKLQSPFERLGKLGKLLFKKQNLRYDIKEFIELVVDIKRKDEFFKQIEHGV
ncbi:MAG: hypothetical protein KME55_21945 [Nostoc indistinguendum CM1-VF10]|jgi:hypothetical protein|nr:hypothetical protein [Nostoc indistinguendum CM1-VF10]